MTVRAALLPVGLLIAAGCAPGDPAHPPVPPDIDGRIAINEVMASNAATLIDDSGAAGDWVELYNPTDMEIWLGGYGMTTDLGDPLAQTLGDDLVLPARGHLLLWLDGDPERGPTHIDLELPREGGDLGLARPDGSVIDRIRYLAQETDVSAARAPDGSDHWRIEWRVSPGEANGDGPGQPIGIEGPATPPELVPAAGDLSAPLYDTSTVIELALELSDEAAASLRQDPDSYVPADLVYQGRRYGPVGLRLKGSNSFQPFDEKPSFRINVNEFIEGATFLGLRDLTLNNMNDDASMLRERLAYEFARDIGVPASRAAHAMITVNGQLYGLYISVETVRRRMLARWFEDSEGPLFEATDVDFRAELIPAYELESGPDDRTLLWGLAEALAASDPDQAIAAAGAYASMSEFIRYWAMCSVIGQFDGFPFSDPGDDYFVYADPTSGRLWFMPWGMDETWLAPDSDPKRVASVLARQCAASPACFRTWVDEVWRLVAVLEDGDYLARAEAIAAQIAPHVALDSRRKYDDATVAIFQEAVRYFIITRRRWLVTELPAPPAPPD